MVANLSHEKTPFSKISEDQLDPFNPRAIYLGNQFVRSKGPRGQWGCNGCAHCFWLNPQKSKKSEDPSDLIYLYPTLAGCETKKKDRCSKIGPL